MKPGYKIKHDIQLENDNCMLVDNFPATNIVWHFWRNINYLKKGKYTIGVWVPKGTKRPDNWPNKTKK